MVFLEYGISLSLGRALSTATFHTEWKLLGPYKSVFVCLNTTVVSGPHILAKI